jgi:hypothetical protein
MHRSRADVNSPYKWKCWTNSGGPCYLTLYSAVPTRWTGRLGSCCSPWWSCTRRPSRAGSWTRSTGIPHRTYSAISAPPLSTFFSSRKSVICLEVHCKENHIYIFLFWELRSLSPNFHIHVPVSDLYITRIGPLISLQKNMLTDPVNI